MVDRRPEPAVSTVSWAWDEHRGPDERDDPGVEIDRDGLSPYRTYTSRPGAQVIARVALWGAVAFGCLGGCVGLVRPAASPAPVAAPATTGVDVPAPVAGAAERVVDAWLSATNDDQIGIGDLFVDDVHLSPRGLDPVIVEGVTAIAGREVSDGYWSVTVAADVREIPDPVAEEASEGTEDGLAPTLPGEETDVVTTWYVEVGIVGDVETGLAALTTPGVLPAPPPAPEGWRRDAAGLTVAETDEQWATIDGFLRALLTGEGDPARYMAPGRSIATASQAPFVAVEPEVMTMSGNPEDGRVRIWVEADVETPGGVHRLVAYEIAMAEREDRWEVVSVSGVPSIVTGESDPSAPGTTVGTGAPGTVPGEDGGERTGDTSSDDTSADGTSADDEVPSDIDGEGPPGSAPTAAEPTSTPN
jgi:hypothetical protein